MAAARDLIVFDMDGTLIDSRHVIVAGMQLGIRRAGLDVPDEAQIIANVGLSMPKVIEALFPTLDAQGNADVVACCGTCFNEMRATNGALPEAPLYPGARAALDRLHARPQLALGVATGKLRRGLEHNFVGHDMGHFFATAQTADDHPSKPHPSMLLRALHETNTQAPRAVIIGDTEFDMAMGRAAGFATIAVSWGYHPVARLKAAGADLVIDDFGALDAAIETLHERRLA